MGTERPQRGERGRPPRAAGTAPADTGSSPGPGAAAAPLRLRPCPRLHLHPHPLSHSHLHPCFPCPSHSFSICIHIRDPVSICILVSIPIPVPVSIHIYIRDRIPICIPVPKPIPVSIPSTAGVTSPLSPPRSLGSLRGLLPAITPGKGLQGQGDISRPSLVPLAVVTEGVGLPLGPAFGEGCLRCACQQNLAGRSSGRAAWSHQTDA